MYAASCIEWHFAAEYPQMPDRIRAAANAGLAAVEFHLWRDKPIEAMRAALDGTRLELVSFVVEPRRSLVDPAQHAEFLQAVEESLVPARRLNANALVVASGFARPDCSRSEQHDAAVGVLRQAAQRAQDAGMMLLLEPLNTRVDHPGMYLDSTSEGLDIVSEVGSPALRLLYDMYHSSIMGERPEEVLQGRMALLGHVQVADAPGRHEPGSGAIDWQAQMQALKDLGYDGAIGLEYKPTGPTLDSLNTARQALGLS